MDVKEIFTSQLVAMHIPEIVAVITGIASVWFAKKENILVYPVGIISVLLYVYICLQVQLYADAAINFYYFILSIYGWYFWKHGKNEPDEELEKQFPIDHVFEEEITDKNTGKLQISFNSARQNSMYLLIVICAGALLGVLLQQFTNTDVAWWDGFVTAFFLVAMILMAKKKIENWVLWIIGDAAAIPLYIYKGLYVSAFQYFVFTILAIAGFLSWFRIYQRNYLLTQES